MRSLRAWTPAVILWTLAACGSGGSETAAVPEAPKPDAPAAPAPAVDKPWKDMNVDERKAYMKRVVLPTMRPHFVSFDADEFAQMKCSTCHGDGAKDGTYAMPNPKLPKLPGDAEGWKKLEADEPGAMKFMKETVVPRMAEMLGEKPYDAATRQGFGCMRCHVTR